MGLSAAVIGAGALGAGASIFGGLTQANAANNATNTQKQMFQTLMGNLQPYNQAGQQDLSTLQGLLPGLTKPFTGADLQNYPGYQFTLQQGMNGVNNSNSALGWGDSGPGAKGIANYVTGLAQQTYGQAFNQNLSQNQQISSLLMGPTQIGANAAAGIGSGATAAGAGIAGTQIGAGNAIAGGAVGASNALSSSPLNFLLMNQLLGQGGGIGAPANNNTMYAIGGGAG